MKESEISDAQILSEVGEILTENPQLRKCSQCSYANDDCTRCSKLDKPIAKWMYSGMCKFYETHEQRLIRQTRESLRQHEAKEKRINYMLTMSLTNLAVSQLFLEYFEEMVFLFACQFNDGTGLGQVIHKESVGSHKPFT
jgi:hypothetical protein